MNLVWNIETKKGCFQGGCSNRLIEAMANFYAEKGQTPENILSIEAYQDGEVLHQLSKTEIEDIQQKIELETERLTEIYSITSNEHDNMIKDARREYFSNLI